MYLVIPTTLDSFFSSVRSLQNLNSSSQASQDHGETSTATDIHEFIRRSLELFAKTSLNNLITGLETMDSNFGLAILLTGILRQGQSLEDFDAIFNRLSLVIEDFYIDQAVDGGGSLAEMCHAFADELIRRGKPSLGLRLVAKAIEKLQASRNMLTSVHSDLCKLALMAKNPAPALKVINGIEFVDTFAKDSAYGTCDTKYILLFFYYAGLVLAAVKDYAQAIFYFEVCVTVPANAVSHIMLEAYKKYVLVSLIHSGQKPRDSLNLPRYTSAVVSRHFKKLTVPYEDLITAFYLNKPDALQEVIAKNKERFEQDQNLGLLDQVVTAQTKTNIIRLTKTFLTLSLTELASKCGIESPMEAEKLLVSMIQEGKIHASISQKDGMVRFDSNPSNLYNSVPVLNLIETSLNSCVRLDKKLTQLEEDIQLDPKFIRKSNQAAASSSATTASGSTGAGSSTSNQLPEDEIALNLVSVSGARMSNGASLARFPAGSSSSNGGLSG